MCSELVLLLCMIGAKPIAYRSLRLILAAVSVQPSSANLEYFMFNRCSSVFKRCAVSNMWGGYGNSISFSLCTATM